MQGFEAYFDRRRANPILGGMLTNVNACLSRTPDGAAGIINPIPSPSHENLKFFFASSGEVIIPRSFRSRS